jgi:hypothetical protein
MIRLLVCLLAMPSLYFATSQIGRADEIRRAYPVGPRWRAVDFNRSVVIGRLDASMNLVDGNTPLSKFKRLANTDGLRPARMQPKWPVRIFTLWTGECFVGQLIGSRDAETIELQFGTDRISVKRSLIRTIAVPHGIREFSFVAAEPGVDGWTDRKKAPFARARSASRWNGTKRPGQHVFSQFSTMRLQPAITAGEITMWLKWPTKKTTPHRLSPNTKPLPERKPSPKSNSDATSGIYGIPMVIPNQQLSFNFGDRNGSSDKVERVLVLKNVDDGVIQIVPPSGRKMTTNRIRLKSQDLNLRLSFGDETVLSINGEVAARSSNSLGKLLFMRIDATTAPTPVGIGYTSVWKRGNPNETRHTAVLSTTFDRVQLYDGGELFGQLLKTTPTNIELETSGSHVAVAWNQVQSVSSRRPKSLALRPITGKLATVRLRSIPGVPTNQPLQLVVAIQSGSNALQDDEIRLGGDENLTAHSLIGTVHIPWRNIQHIEPLGDCTYRVLRAVPLHLGNSTRTDFQAVQPDGTETEFEFMLSEAPTKLVVLSMLASNVEPSGPETLAASPQLKELRAGHYTTEVWVNKKFSGTLNGYVSHQWKANEPKRIEVTILPQNLVAGKNAILLRQKPSLSDIDDYNDCEIKTIGLKLMR